jgi:hypothetical protein
MKDNIVEVLNKIPSVMSFGNFLNVKVQKIKVK